jgi:hypothetical protein
MILSLSLSPQVSISPYIYSLKFGHLDPPWDPTLGRLLSTSPTSQARLRRKYDWGDSACLRVSRIGLAQHRLTQDGCDGPQRTNVAGWTKSPFWGTM